MANDTTSAIDKAISAVKAKQALKGKTAETATDGAKPTVRVIPPKPTDAERAAARAAKQAQLEADRAERKRIREEKRAAKLAEREANRKPAHMSKVERAAARLPILSESANEMFTDITTNLSRDQVAALSAHLAHFNRAMATQFALSAKIAEGDEVRITGGDPRYIGQTGVVTKAARIRCYVAVEGLTKDLYMFTSDVEKVEAEVGEIEEPAAANG